MILPMDGDVVLNMVNHFDKKTITLPSNYAGPRKQTIHCDHALCVAQSRNILVLYLHKQ